MKLRPQFDTEKWAYENFGDCPLGHAQRSQRLELMARQAADRPTAPVSVMGEDWGGAKGIYRLLDREETTLQSVTQVHRKRVKQQEGRFLILSDITHVDFGRDRKLPNAGSVGPGKSKGFLLHSGLMTSADDGSLVGLAGQVAHIRSGKKKGKQNDSKRAKRWRESEMWPELMIQVGPPPSGSQYIHVCDSAADSIDCYCTAKLQQSDFLVRAGRLHRKVVVEAEKMRLDKAISGASELGSYTLEIPRGNGRKARQAKLRVSSRAIELPAPRNRTQRVKDYVKEHGETIPAWVVVVEEIDPPSGVEPIKWVLVTSVPVTSFDEADEVIGWYEDRWLVEEWHKALKSGCALESRQLQSVDRLLALTGVLSVVAVMLVQFKSAARTQPQRPARELVPPLWLKLLAAKKLIDVEKVTNYEFWRALAKLGGFLGRRHDGEPGWQTIWRGWQTLHTYIEGAELSQSCG